MINPELRLPSDIAEPFSPLNHVLSAAAKRRGSFIRARAAADQAASVNVEAEFRGDDDLFAHGRESFADEFFILKRPINLRRIKESNAAFDGCANDLDAMLPRRRRPIAGAQAHTAESQR